MPVTRREHDQRINPVGKTLVALSMAQVLLDLEQDDAVS